MPGSVQKQLATFRLLLCLLFSRVASWSQSASAFFLSVRCGRLPALLRKWWASTWTRFGSEGPSPLTMKGLVALASDLECWQSTDYSIDCKKKEEKKALGFILIDLSTCGFLWLILLWLTVCQPTLDCCISVDKPTLRLPKQFWYSYLSWIVFLKTTGMFHGLLWDIKTYILIHEYNFYLLTCVSNRKLQVPQGVPSPEEETEKYS